MRFTKFVSGRICPSLSLLLSTCPHPGLSSLRGLTQLENPEAWGRGEEQGGMAAFSALNPKADSKQ